MSLKVGQKFSPQLASLAKTLHEKQPQVELWLSSKESQAKLLQPCSAPIVSVDVRVGLDKIAPVDTNVFPSGFNKISQESLATAAQELHAAITKCCQGKDCLKVAIIAEHFTRNVHYFENALRLQKIIEMAGFEAKVVFRGWVKDQVTEGEIPAIHETFFGKLEIGVLNFENGMFLANDGFKPDAIFLNNDLSDGAYGPLAESKIPVLPNYNFGWFKRQKLNHFTQYQNLLNDLADFIGVEGGLLDPLIAKFDQAKLSGSASENDAEAINKGLKDIFNSSERSGSDVAVFVKANNGTYGMGIEVVRQEDLPFSFSKKVRNKFKAVKEGLGVESVLLQEGIPSNISYLESPAEIMLYTSQTQTIDWVVRFNPNKDALGNLNSAGISFESIGRESPILKDFAFVIELIGKVCAMACSFE